jgi:hypothetical protein
MPDNLDDLRQQMEMDDLSDATKLSPREYGKLRGISPQLVYYHIRQNHIKQEHCICGRNVIDVQAADEYFKKGDFEPDNTLEEI